jgi:YD repeat-containing protein
MALWRYISIIAIVAGLALAGAPWWWPAVVGSSRAWSDAQAKEYSQAGANLHRQTYDASQRLAGETNAAAVRYNRNRQALDQARNAGHTAATIMQCVGIATVLAGLLGYSARRPDSNSA